MSANSETGRGQSCTPRSEEHTSELQSRLHLVCRLLLEKKKTADHVRFGSAADFLSSAQQMSDSQTFAAPLRRHAILLTLQRLTATDLFSHALFARSFTC